MLFPSNPVIGQTHFSAHQAWTWDGTSWVVNDARDAKMIGGLLVETTSIQENDLLRFNSGAWRNVSQSEIVNGGDF